MANRDLNRTVTTSIPEYGELPTNFSNLQGHRRPPAPPDQQTEMRGLQQHNLGSLMDGRQANMNAQSSYLAGLNSRSQPLDYTQSLPLGPSSSSGLPGFGLP